MLTFWRGLFAVAAFYNLAVGGAMMAAPARIAAQLGVSGTGAAYAMLMVGLMIAVSASAMRLYRRRRRRTGGSSGWGRSSARPLASGSA